MLAKRLSTFLSCCSKVVGMRFHVFAGYNMENWQFKQEISKLFRISHTGSRKLPCYNIENWWKIATLSDCHSERTVLCRKPVVCSEGGVGANSIAMCLALKNPLRANVVSLTSRKIFTRDIAFAFIE